MGKELTTFLFDKLVGDKLIECGTEKRWGGDDTRQSSLRVLVVLFVGFLFAECKFSVQCLLISWKE